MQVPEYGLQAGLVAWLLVGRKWTMLAAQLLYLGYNCQQYLQRQHLFDVTEAFRCDIQPCI